MKRNLQLSAVIEREGDGFVSLCPELDLASQGDTIEEARANLVEALELFFEVADESEIARRLSRPISDGDDEMRGEYDFRGGVRGKYAERYAGGTNIVLLDPDLVEVFRDETHDDE
ncbi:MAG TPA: type II toxin-antitoxin system HicB family antitoxin [Longimicrobium sp.]|nr:type II toxin-antitoxin system HicB family antitoxin [Longimicrobium sp.]